MWLARSDFLHCPRITNVIVFWTLKIGFTGASRDFDETFPADGIDRSIAIEAMHELRLFTKRVHRTPPSHGFLDRAHSQLAPWVSGRPVQVPRWHTGGLKGQLVRHLKDPQSGGITSMRDFGTFQVSLPCRFRHRDVTKMAN